MPDEPGSEGPERTVVQARLRKMSDEEVVRLLELEADGWHPTAVAMAAEEARSRGLELSAIKATLEIDDRRAEEESRMATEKRRRSATLWGASFAFVGVVLGSRVPESGSPLVAGIYTLLCLVIGAALLAYGESTPTER